MGAYLKCEGCKLREGRLVEMRRDLSALQERIDRLETELDAVRARLRRLKGERDRYMQQVIEYGGHITEHGQRVMS